ncbi:hypothetical protein [Streptomyces sp. NPDC051704]|uniref:hypothetical protein n=1 Tax=Streptomyces sp. NPDC051704 TaxID=3365671 RepID=UPI0037BCD43B
MLIFELIEWAAVDLNIPRWPYEGIYARHSDAHHDAFPSPFLPQVLGEINGLFGVIRPGGEDGIRIISTHMVFYV